MITYNKVAAKSITNAVKKAKQVKPLVKPIAGEFGKYQVCGSKGDCYIVTYAKQGQEFTADCNCTAGKAGRVCYHIVAASAIYKKAVADRALARKLELMEMGKITPTKRFSLHQTVQVRATGEKGTVAVTNARRPGVSDYSVIFNRQTEGIFADAENFNDEELEPVLCECGSQVSWLYGKMEKCKECAEAAKKAAQVEPVEATVFCSNCQTRYATGPDGLCSLCRDYTPEMAAKDRSDLFG